MTLGLGTGPGMGQAGGAAAFGPSAPTANPNLLLWTDDFSNAAWDKVQLLVTVDLATIPQTGQLADELQALNLNNRAGQTTTTGGTGADVTTVIPFLLVGWNRYSVTGTFSTGTYTFSLYAKDAGGGGAYVLRIASAGGFLRCTIENVLGDGDALCGSAQLEKAGTPTTYHPRNT
ncbi:MAG TPA: hypothetical protein VGH94_11160 [Acidimicrobiales bacterium]|jgi:hypothetical protein